MLGVQFFSSLKYFLVAVNWSLFLFEKVWSKEPIHFQVMIAGKNIVISTGLFV